jgi:hypothetical protein
MARGRLRYPELKASVGAPSRELTEGLLRDACEAIWAGIPEPREILVDRDRLMRYFEGEQWLGPWLVPLGELGFLEPPLPLPDVGTLARLSPAGALLWLVGRRRRVGGL